MYYTSFLLSPTCSLFLSLQIRIHSRISLINAQENNKVYCQPGEVQSTYEGGSMTCQIVDAGPCPNGDNIIITGARGGPCTDLNLNVNWGSGVGSADLSGSFPVGGDDTYRIG